MNLKSLPLIHLFILLNANGFLKIFIGVSHSSQPCYPNKESDYLNILIYQLYTYDGQEVYKVVFSSVNF